MKHAFPETISVFYTNFKNLRQKQYWLRLVTLGLHLLIYVVAQGQRQRQLLSGVSKGLSNQWELDDSTRRGTWVVVPYKPVCIRAGRWSSNPNEQPISENPLYTIPFVVPYNEREAKFHLSFKTKAIQGAFRGKGDIWIGYTQKAHWQLYNSDLSKRFRELNYEPEVMLNFPIRFTFFGLQGRMVGVSLNHQSNGRIVPLSRSWNRIFFMQAWSRVVFK